jgi:hypothetical protein
MQTVLPDRQRLGISWLRRRPAVAITILATVVGGSGFLATGSAGAASTSQSRAALHSRTAAGVASTPPSSALIATGRTYGVTYQLRTGSITKSISLFVIGGSSAQTFVPAVYDVDSAGRPRSLVVVGPRVTVAAHAVGKVVVAALPAKHLRAGKYVLAIAAVSGRGSARALLGSASDASFWKANSRAVPAVTWGAIHQVAVPWAFTLNSKPEATIPSPPVTGPGAPPSSVSSSTPPPAAPPVGLPTSTPRPAAPAAATPPASTPVAPPSSTPPPPAPPASTPPSSAPPVAPPSSTPPPPAPPASTPPPVTTSSAVGLQAGVALATHAGNYLINTSNVALSNVHITGDLTIDAPASNVAVANVQVDGHININTDTPSSGGVGIVPANIVLSHVDAHGLSAVGFDGLTVASSRIHDVNGMVSQIASYSGSGKTWSAQNLVIKGSAFYGIRFPGSGAHLEALHLMAVKGVLLTGNVFDGRVADQATWNQVTATLTMEAMFQGVFNSDVTISGNTFYGGSYYQTYLLMVGNSSVTNNQFISYTSPDGTHTSSVQFPVSGYTPGSNEPASGFPYFAQSGNTLNGSAVSLPGGR